MGKDSLLYALLSPVKHSGTKRQLCLESLCPIVTQTDGQVDDGQSDHSGALLPWRNDIWGKIHYYMHYCVACEA